MRCHYLAFLLALVVSCSENPTRPAAGTVAASGGVIQLHIEAQPESEAVHTFELDGEEVHVGPAQEVRLSSVRRTQDASGDPALGFDVALSDRDRFEAICQQAYDEKARVLFAVNGTPLSYPTMNAVLRSGGIVEGGRDGFSEAALTELIQQLSAND